MHNGFNKYHLIFWKYEFDDSGMHVQAAIIKL